VSLEYYTNEMNHDICKKRNTNLIIEMGEEGVPPNLQAMPKEEVKKEEDSGNFLTKYWYYIVPVAFLFILQMLSAGGTQGEGEGS